MHMRQLMNLEYMVSSCDAYKIEIKGGLFLSNIALKNGHYADI